jgi:Tfp pilus assembly protein PilO
MKKSSSAFYAGLAFLLSLAAFIYAWKFIIPSYHNNKVALATMENEIDSANKKLESLEQAKKTLDQLGDLPDQLFIAVPEDKDMPNLITELEALAKKHNIVIPSMQITDGTAASAAGGAAGTAVVQSSGQDSISISFSVTGSFDELGGLINSLEKDIRFMNIKSVSLSSAEEGGMGLSVQLEAYKRTQTVSDTGSSSTTSSTTGSGTSGGTE